MSTTLRHARRPLIRSGRVPARLAPRHTCGRAGGRRPGVRPVLLAVGLVAGVSMLGQAGATFGVARRVSATLTGTTLDQYLPAAATAVRTAATTCRVSWTPSVSAPAGLHYDVTDGASGTLAADVDGLTALVSVPVSAITPAVRARLQSWVSAGEHPIDAPCLGWPDAPADLDVQAGDQRIDVSWTAPAGNGGTVTSYTAVLNPGNHSCTVAAPTTTCAFTGLTTGTAYSLSVVAVSQVGGSPSATGSATPSDHLPGAPTSVTADPSHGQVEVGWSAPASDGGSPVTGYTVTATPTGGGLPTRTCGAAPGPCTVTGLTDGVRYAVTVAAQNAHGTGTASTGVIAIPYPSTILAGGRLALWLDAERAGSLFTDSGCATPATAGQPVGCWSDRSGHGHDAVQATAGSRPVLAAVGGDLVPGFDGGDRLGYSGLPTGTDPSAAFVVARSDDPSPAGSGVRVVNGWGTVSVGGTRTLTKANASADTALEADSLGPVPIGDWTGAGWHQFDDAWTSAAGGTLRGWSAGGGLPAATSTGYAYSTGSGAGSVGDGPGGGAGWDGPVAEVIVLADPVTAGERRTVQEYLARKWGQRIAPSAPASPSAAAAGATSISVSWNGPGWDGGDPVTGYTATASPGGATCTSVGTACTIGGLPAGQSYTVTVTATSAAGTGPASDPQAVSL